MKIQHLAFIALLVAALAVISWPLLSAKKDLEKFNADVQAYQKRNLLPED